MINTWAVIVPPILVLILAFATHRVITSLLIGVLTSALIANNFYVFPSITTSINRLWGEVSDISNLFIFIFLFCVGIIIVLINQTGGTKAYAEFVRKKLKSKKSAEISSVILSLFFFIDEYLNIITVGSVMKPLTDKFKIARTKLAFLVKALAAPLCIIAPISSWGAFIIGQLGNSGVSKNISPETTIIASPLNLFVQTIPFSFYTLTMIASVYFIVMRKISFGLMKEHEQIASKTENLFGGKKPKNISKDVVVKDAHMYDFLFPIIFLVGSCFIALFFTDFVPQPALFFGGTITLIATILFLLFRKKIRIKEIMPYGKNGINLMLASVITVTIAWTFSDVITLDLHTGEYLASKLTGIISPMMLPIIFFIASTITALATCSAWGSIAILIPIAIQMLLSLKNIPGPIVMEVIPVIFPTISAILSGAVAGNQLSPVSDITVMTVTSTGAYHMDHVKTQLEYILIVIFSAAISFLMSGILIQWPLYQNAFTSLFTGITTAIILFLIMNIIRRK